MKFLLIVSDNPSGGLSAIKSISGEGDVLVSAALGTEKLNGSLKKCLDSGASEAYRIMDGDFLGSDTWAVSRIYAAFRRWHI
jgi:electron transfer flavoprotein alpha/beta subunit